MLSLVLTSRKNSRLYAENRRCLSSLVHKHSAARRLPQVRDDSQHYIHTEVDINTSDELGTETTCIAHLNESARGQAGFAHACRSGPLYHLLRIRLVNSQSNLKREKCQGNPNERVVNDLIFDDSAADLQRWMATMSLFGTNEQVGGHRC